MIGKRVERSFHVFSAVLRKFGTRDALARWRCHPFFWSGCLDIALHFQDCESLLRIGRAEVQRLSKITTGPTCDSTCLFEETERCCSRKRHPSGLWRLRQKLLGYSTRTSFMTAPDGFWVSTSAFPFTANSYWLLAPMTNALFATMAFVVSILAVTVYVPVLRESA